MLIRSLIAQLLALTVFGCSTNAETRHGDLHKTLSARIDSLLASKPHAPFNGTIIIAHEGNTMVVRCSGTSDTLPSRSLALNDQFVIGSISKQITAVLVLREVERGRINLNAPIRAYLPELPRSWADTVTVHQLLTHTHGITSLEAPLSFPPGTRFDYSQLGFDLLAQIVERTSKRSFAECADELFALCGMPNTLHPKQRGLEGLVRGMIQGADGKRIAVPLSKSLENYVAAGGFISTAPDMIAWNAALHGSKLLADSTFRLMMRKHSVRQHPFLGPVDYGYGVMISDNDSLLQLGLLGYAPGFASMNYYFPSSKTSVVVLENLVTDPDDLHNAFFYHLGILKIVREEMGLKGRR